MNSKLKMRSRRKRFKCYFGFVLEHEHKLFSKHPTFGSMVNLLNSLWTGTSDLQKWKSNVKC